MCPLMTDVPSDKRVPEAAINVTSPPGWAPGEAGRQEAMAGNRWALGPDRVSSVPYLGAVMRCSRPGSPADDAVTTSPASLLVPMKWPTRCGSARNGPHGGTAMDKPESADRGYGRAITLREEHFGVLESPSRRSGRCIQWRALGGGSCGKGRSVRLGPGASGRWREPEGEPSGIRIPRPCRRS